MKECGGYRKMGEEELRRTADDIFPELHGAKVNSMHGSLYDIGHSIK